MILLYQCNLNSAIIETASLELVSDVFRVTVFFFVLTHYFVDADGKLEPLQDHLVLRIRWVHELLEGYQQCSPKSFDFGGFAFQER